MTVVMSRFAEAYARFGSREEAHATLKRVLELEPNDGLALYNCACAYALLGEKRASLILFGALLTLAFGRWRIGPRPIALSTRCTVMSSFNNCLPSYSR